MRVFLFCFMVIAVFGLPGAVAQTVSNYRKFGKHDGVQPIASKGATSVYDGIIAAQARQRRPGVADSSCDNAREPIQRARSQRRKLWSDADQVPERHELWI